MVGLARRSGRSLALTVNLSAQQLQEADFVDRLKAILDRTGLDPNQLVLEMTETAIFHDTTSTIARLEATRALGVRIAIDDFGTGYSSLGYLRRFQADILKVAKEFIGHPDRPDEWPFAAAIVALGRALGMTIIAEGIEEPGQLAKLRELGCQLGQGYLFSPSARSRRDPRVPGRRPVAAEPRRGRDEDARPRRPAGAGPAGRLMFILYAIPAGILAGLRRSVAGSRASARSGSGGPGCSCSAWPSSSSCSRTS